MKNSIFRGRLERGLRQFTDLVGCGFLGGMVDTQMHTMLANLKTAFVNELIDLKLGFLFFLLLSHQLRSLYQAETETLKLNIIGTP